MRWKFYVSLQAVRVYIGYRIQKVNDLPWIGCISPVFWAIVIYISKSGTAASREP